jgi:hypothetical protein
MFEFIKSIPDVVWAAMLASLLTLIGVILSNRNSRAQTFAQLEHDSAQRDREREMALRQDVYLRAAEAVSKGQNILGRLSNLNLSNEELGGEFSQVSAALAKIQVVGTNETFQAVSAYSRELASAYLELLLKRDQLLKRKNSIEALCRLLDRSRVEQDRCSNLMKQLNIDGNRDQRVWAFVKGNFEFEQQQQEKYSQQQQELWTMQSAEHLKFAELLLGKYVEVSKLIPAAVIAVREELDLRVDPETYLASYREDIEKGTAVVQSFLTEVAARKDTQERP